MAEVDKDKELAQALKKIDWGSYLQYGIIELKIREGECKTIEIKRTYLVPD